MNSVWKTALDRIHAEEQLKERTRTYLAQQLVQQQTRRRTHWRPALASLCLLLMLALGSYWLFLVPTAFISIDLKQAIADSLQLQYLDYRQALQELLDSQEIGSYLEQDAVLSMTVSGQDSKQCGSILQEVEGCAATHQNIHCHAGDIELVSQAHAAGMSLGKYSCSSLTLPSPRNRCRDSRCVRSASSSILIPSRTPLLMPGRTTLPLRQREPAPTTRRNTAISTAAGAL